MLLHLYRLQQKPTREIIMYYCPLKRTLYCRSQPCSGSDTRCFLLDYLHNIHSSNKWHKAHTMLNCRPQTLSYIWKHTRCCRIWKHPSQTPFKSLKSPVFSTLPVCPVPHVRRIFSYSSETYYKFCSCTNCNCKLVLTLLFLSATDKI